MHNVFNIPFPAWEDLLSFTIQFEIVITEVFIVQALEVEGYSKVTLQLQAVGLFLALDDASTRANPFTSRKKNTAS